MEIKGHVQKCAIEKEMKKLFFNYQQMRIIK
jgi:hypothetical protein